MIFSSSSFGKATQPAVGLPDATGRRALPPSEEPEEPAGPGDGRPGRLAPAPQLTVDCPRR
jgi:hypothetical protein